MKTKGIYFLFRALQALALPVLLLYFLFRSLRKPGYWRSWPERLGFLPASFQKTAGGCIWLHAVSVGEVIACLELVRRLRADFPHSGLYVSVATVAGRAAADEKLRGIADGIFYVPVDYVWAVRRVLRKLRPAVVVVAETEIWPNLFREVHRTGAGLAIVNGRISDRAMPTYIRWRWFFPPVLAAVDTILAQTEALAQRFVALGAPPERVQVGGNFKYDFEARAADEKSLPARWIARTEPGKVWIAASTMPPAHSGDVDEDEAVIAAYREVAQRHPELRLILAPRRPERFDAAAAKLAAAGIAFERRSALEEGSARVLLLDTIGELSSLFAYADVVFMGGTLADRGGHNILEPAFFAKPVIAGPHMENFQAMADEFTAAGACVRIANPQELAPAVERLIGDAGDIGARARECAMAKRGATARALEEVHRILRVPRYRPAEPWFLVAWLLARVWRWESRRRQVRDYGRRRRLDAPVISVGNLTMGGTGKTPCVMRLAEALRDRGHLPAILTRGYGRASRERSLVLARGAAANTSKTGDEAQIFLRSGVAALGIGADRYETAELLRQQLEAGVFVLDDGFQHVKLARDFDLVLVDGLNPFGGGEVFPVGRLREPVAGIARAHAILITRSNLTDLTPAIEREVRRWNPSAPVYRGRIEVEAWIENATGRRLAVEEVKFDRAGVVCGVGNPEGFHRTLKGLGVHEVDWVDFEDHHAYTPTELRRIAEQFRRNGATAILTTEKDAVNLHEGCEELTSPLPVYWLKARMAIDGEGDLLRAIEERMKGKFGSRITKIAR